MITSMLFGARPSVPIALEGLVGEAPGRCEAPALVQGGTLEDLLKAPRIQVVRDKEGAITSGDPNQTSTVVDHWNFSRKLGSSDPIWTLIATQA